MEVRVLCFFLLILPCFVKTESNSPIYNVMDYGAHGDGHTDDTKAFMKAWEAACSSSSSSSPTMHVPSEMTFMIQPLYFRGECDPKQIDVEINGNIIAPKDPSDWTCHDGCREWIHFEHVDGLRVYGSGTINGQGQKWWDLNALKISNSNNVYLTSLTFKDNPRVHVDLQSSKSVFISNLSIDAPEDSPNTDGDDCISMVDGSSNIQISNIACGPGHGISVGSLGKHGAEDKVEDIHVSDVVFTGTTNGARIKTWQNTAVQVSNVIFREFLGTSKKETAVMLDCSEAAPCTDITLDNIYLRTTHGHNAKSVNNNAHGRTQGLVVPEIPLS
ncbi:unnamed protein product [Ilex paraguariensis]|uniref:Polygalacturonase n=1 Tax=Ilex paraguariensis TaxID=185542 RepID=A0ABC8SEW7_9AQUA